MTASRPHLVGLLSIWPETFSHTLTEAWAAGIPVLASGLGALGERVRAHGGGWVLDNLDPTTVWPIVKAPISTVTAGLRTFRVTPSQGAAACPAK